MRRSSILALALIAVIGARDARAQSAVPPVEVGLDVAATPGNGSDFHRGPRLVVNVDGRNAVQFTASFQKLSPWDDAQIETDLYLAAYRRVVHAAGPVRVFAAIGGGLERTVIVAPAVTFGDPPITFPGSRGVHVRPAFTTGGAIDVRFWSRAAVVFESSIVLGDQLGARFSGGVVVALGPGPAPPGRLAPSVPWSALDSGDRAWLTTSDGREIDGEVVGRSATALTLRTPSGTTSFTADDVRAIDTTDPIRNGTVLGAAIGGLGAVFPAILASSLACVDREECDAGEVLSVGAIVIGIGTGIGAATGALADSLRERRVPLFRRASAASLTVAPIVSGQRLGGRAVIRW